MGVAVDRQLAAADTLLLGRRTYDSFAGAWPDREARRVEPPYQALRRAVSRPMRA
jgi:dihydrofolate reductase